MQLGLSKLLLVACALCASSALRAEGAGAALQGVAAIAAAGSQIGAAGIQAAADVKVNKINADTSVEVTKIKSAESMYNQDNNKDVAIGTSLISAGVAINQEAGVTERLGMNLDFAREGRQMSYDLQREAMLKDDEIKRQTIEIARAQSKALVEEYRYANHVQLEIMGLSGAGSAYASGGGLTIRRASEIDPRNRLLDSVSPSSEPIEARAAMSSSRPTFARSAAGMQRSDLSTTRVASVPALPIASRSEVEASTPHRTGEPARALSRNSTHANFD